jgi:hypothetical protein
MSWLSAFEGRSLRRVKSVKEGVGDLHASEECDCAGQAWPAESLDTMINYELLLD